jgi:hypothetical protein
MEMSLVRRKEKEPAEALNIAPTSTNYEECLACQ